MKKPKVLGFDLETIADRSMTEFLPEIKGMSELMDQKQIEAHIVQEQKNVVPRKNIKDPEKIRADIEKKQAKVKTDILEAQSKLKTEVGEKQIKQIKEMGLNPHHNLICCFGWCDGKNSGYIMLSDETAAAEAALISEAWELLHRYDHFVTFNGIEFDVPILNLHSLFRKVRPSVTISTRKYMIENHTDLRAVLGGWDRFAPGKMDFYMRRLFGAGKPAEIDGSKVQDYWDVGLHEDIGEYCEKDAVDVMRFYEVAKKFHPLVN